MGWKRDSPAQVAVLFEHRVQLHVPSHDVHRIRDRLSDDSSRSTAQQLAQDGELKVLSIGAAGLLGVLHGQMLDTCFDDQMLEAFEGRELNAGVGYHADESDREAAVEGANTVGLQVDLADTVEDAVVVFALELEGES